MDDSDQNQSEQASQATRENSGEGTSNLPKGHQFDFLNWFYWNLWWQHYSYWSMMLQSPQMWGPSSLGPSQFMGAPRMGTGPEASSDSGNGTNSQSQQHPQWPINQPWNGMYQQPIQQPMQQPFGAAGPFPYQQQPGMGIGQIRLRIITGFETYIAPVWRRCLAELIDMFLFGLLLKWYFPDTDYRVPEVLFKGSDVWKSMEDEELMDTRDTLMLFLVSVILQRFFHAFLEMGWLLVFRCTPGKWLMGLRVWRCTGTPHLTRTAPGYSIRVEPGGRITIISAFLRSLFKATISLFIPTFVFFFHMSNGRTKYDELFQTAVVDTFRLNRPIYGTLRNIQIRPGQNLGGVGNFRREQQMRVG